MARVIAIMLDGLRRDFVRPGTTPNLCRLASRATVFEAHRSVFPSATRVVSAAFATGCHPARNGLQGNAMALMEDGRLVLHDAGKPEFLQHKRAVTGCSLAMPTLAERLACLGGAIVFNNVSPGAAYAHDPDGHGHVYHRAGSFGPGTHPGARSVSPRHPARHRGRSGDDPSLPRRGGGGRCGLRAPLAVRARHFPARTAARLAGASRDYWRRRYAGRRRHRRGRRPHRRRRGHPADGRLRPRPPDRHRDHRRRGLPRGRGPEGGTPDPTTSWWRPTEPRRSSTSIPITPGGSTRSPRTSQSSPGQAR